MQNRLSKLAGTIAWSVYAGYLQGEQQRGRADMGKLTHQLLSVLLGATALFSLVIGNLASSSGLQISLICWGFVYGLADSGVTSLTLWRWAHDDRRRRFDVALLNSCFTVGALITPVLVAASLRYGGGRWTFDVIAAAAVAVGAMLPMLPDAPMPPLMSDKGDGEKGEGGALKRVDVGGAALERGKGSDEALDGRGGDEEARAFALRPGELGVNPRQLARAARHYSARLLRSARQQIQTLRNPSDELVHQARVHRAPVVHSHRPRPRRPQPHPTPARPSRPERPSRTLRRKHTHTVARHAAGARGHGDVHRPLSDDGERARGCDVARAVRREGGRTGRAADGGDELHVLGRHVRPSRTR